MAVYDEPFWRADGLSGQGVGFSGPVNAEAAVRSMGYMDGAVGSGERAAAEVLAAL